MKLIVICVNLIVTVYVKKNIYVTIINFGSKSKSRVDVLEPRYDALLKQTLDFISIIHIVYTGSRYLLVILDKTAFLN